MEFYRRYMYSKFVCFLGVIFMIIKTNSTVFNVNADCIVNTINCDGFMGKGLALEFSLRYPKLNKIYQDQAKRKELHTGKVYFYEIDGQKMINFPTKYHCRDTASIRLQECFWLFQHHCCDISSFPSQ